MPIFKGLQFSDKRHEGQASSQTCLGEFHESPEAFLSCEERPEKNLPVAASFYRDGRRKGSECKVRKALLLWTDVGQTASVATRATTVAANVVIEERFNRTSAERCTRAGIVLDGHILDSRN